MTKWIFIIILMAILGVGGAYFWLRSTSNFGTDGQANQAAAEDNQDLNGEQPGRVTFKNLGPAPEFKKIDSWLNGDPQTIAELQNKVILINFWTYSCNTCINALSTLNSWTDTYKDSGLAIIGVHTPQYNFEKIPENVQNVIDRFKINYSIALDNSYATWTAYKNQFWPAMYLIDRNGKIMYTHYGDGGLKTTEKAIRLLLGLETDPLSPIAAASDPNQVKSPAIPLGLKHLDFFANETIPSNTEKKYRLPATLAVNTLALEGKWKLENEKAVMAQPLGKIKLKFNAAKVYLKANAAKATSLKITVDGKTQLPVSVEGSDTYTLFDSGDYGEHIIEIDIPDAGFEALQFSFG
jgi:thiol-disulfide isomerase/thioredoxin